LQVIDSKKSDYDFKKKQVIDKVKSYKAILIDRSGGNAIQIVEYIHARMKEVELLPASRSNMIQALHLTYCLSETVDFLCLVPTFLSDINLAIRKTN
jgi:hypothetical protein